MANKAKQNLRFQKASARQNKITFKGLSPEQKNYMQAKLNYEEYDKQLNRFWATAKRNSSGAVDWKNMTESELDLFELINKEKEKYFNKMNKLEQNINAELAEITFRTINTHSMSY